MSTVRDAAFAVLRELGLHTIFANPGSTEVPLLADLPESFDFVLGLHESSVVGMATGHAIARDRPAFVNVHTVAGLGNAVGALATARQNRAPLVVAVGQQDRRHLEARPFLSGPVDRLAEPYPVSVQTPLRAQDVPGALARAHHAASTERGPALVVVPMDDWRQEFDGEQGHAAPLRLLRAAGVDVAAVESVAARLRASSHPAVVVGAGADEPATWAALRTLVERLGAPVWQEAFSARAGFPHDHPRFAGHLPAARSALRDTLAPHDLVLVVGAPVFRQYAYEPGPFAPESTTIVQVTDDASEAWRAGSELSVVAPLAPFVTALAGSLPAGTPTDTGRGDGPTAPGPSPAGRIRADDVLTALGGRLPANATVVEETPSSRLALLHRLPAREPLGFLSAAGGGLGFGIPAAIGVKLARPDRPVVAVVGDGSSLYSIQALWSAARYQAGVLVVVLANGGYQILGQLVRAFDPAAKAPWPDFPEVSVAAMAEALGCPATRVGTGAELDAVLDEVVPTLAARTSPLVVEAAVEP